MTQLKELSLEDLMNVEVATVTTASKRSEKATEAPGTVVVVDQNDIKLRGYRNLKDVLRDMPGMETAEMFFSEIGTQVGVRGIGGNNKLVVLVNGMRVNPPGGEYFPFRSDFSIRDAKQIEIIYGPGSTLYGQDAMSGVINIKTADAPASGEWFRGGGEYGLNNERETWISFGKAFDSVPGMALTGYFQYHNSDLTSLDRDYSGWWQDYRSVAGPKAGKGLEPFREDYGVNGFARFTLGDFSLQSWYRDSRRSSSEGFSPALGFLPDAIWSDWSWVTEAKHTWQISDRVKLESSLAYNRYEIGRDSRYVWPASATDWFFNDFKFGTQSSISAEEILRIDITDKLSALWGICYNNYDVIPKSTIPGGARGDDESGLLSQGGSFVYYTIPGDPASRREIPRVVEEDWVRYGTYLEANWRLAPRFSVLAGARVDKDTRIDDPSFTPRAAMILDLNDHLTVKYSYTTAYISPSPYFGYATFDNGTLLNTSNSDLDPETSATHEVNFTYHTDKANLGLSLYHGEQQNLLLLGERGLPPNIIQNPVYLDPTDATSKRQLGHTVNSGTSRNDGLDFFGQLQLAPTLNSWFSYSLAAYKEITSDLDYGLFGLSRHNVRLGATWAVTPKVFITPSLIWRSTPANVIGGTLASELQNPYQVNLHLLYTPTDHVETYIGVENLTDHRYALGGILGQAFPEESIHGVFGVRLKF